MFVAYLIGQLLTMFDVLDYFQLHIFEFVSVIIAFLITVILPMAKYSELFNPRRGTGADKYVDPKDDIKGSLDQHHTDDDDLIEDP